MCQACFLCWCYKAAEKHPDGFCFYVFYIHRRFLRVLDIKQPPWEMLPVHNLQPWIVTLFLRHVNKCIFIGFVVKIGLRIQSGIKLFSPWGSKATLYRNTSLHSRLRFWSQLILLLQQTNNLVSLLLNLSIAHYYKRSDRCLYVH